MNEGADHSPCWKRIGVWESGDRSCPQLKTHIHCRNCPIFIKEGRKLFERPLSEDDREEWREILARKEQQLISPKAVSLFIFRLGQEWYALSTQKIREIALKTPIHTLPHLQPPPFLGLVVLHGELYSCLSLHSLFSGIQEEDASSHLIFLSGNRGEDWAFPIEEIRNIHSIPLSHLSAPPLPKNSTSLLRATFSFKKEKVGVIDDEKLFSLIREKISLLEENKPDFCTQTLNVISESHL